MSSPATTTTNPPYDALELLDAHERSAIQQKILEAGTHTVEPVLKRAAVDTVKTQLTLIAPAGQGINHFRFSLEGI